MRILLIARKKFEETSSFLIAGIPCFSPGCHFLSGAENCKVKPGRLCFLSLELSNPCFSAQNLGMALHHHKHKHHAVHERRRKRLVKNSLIQTFIWKEIGGLYPYADFLSGFFFIGGSFLFFLGPFLFLVEADVSTAGLDWIQMGGVIMLTGAKFGVEGRALYAHFFKGPSSQVGLLYHFAIAGFFIGGLLFGASLAVDLLKGPVLAAAITSLCSSLLFLLGSVMFVVDSWGHVVHDHFHSRASNAYFLGSFFFWLGSAFFVLGSCFQIIIIYQSLTDLLAPSMNTVGSFFFIVGSVFYLVLGYWEITSFRNDQELPHITRRLDINCAAEPGGGGPTL